jgi:hypothetical protein
MTLNFQSFNIKLSHILSHVCVNTDRVLDWILDLLPTLTHDSQLHLIIASSLISTLYKSHAKSFPACSVFTSNCLVMASNYGYSSASGLKASLNGSSLPTAFLINCAPTLFFRLPYRTDLVAPVVFLINPQHGPQ